jgi:hypothetical protein
MRQIVIRFIFVMLLGLSFNAFAQQSNGGGSGGGMKDACEISGGTFTGSESGNWACCWSDWGCYGCVDGNCKMNCKTKRCRKANAMSQAGTGQQAVTGLAPSGMKAPVVPKNMKENVNNSGSNVNQMQ